MSRFRLVRRFLTPATGGGGGAGSLSPIYDTRFGTGNDANNLFTFGLRPGCRRIWVNAVSGNDANDGLTAATAKATYNAGMQLHAEHLLRTGDAEHCSF